MEHHFSHTENSDWGEGGGEYGCDYIPKLILREWDVNKNREGMLTWLIW